MLSSLLALQKALNKTKFVHSTRFCISSHTDWCSSNKYAVTKSSITFGKTMKSLSTQRNCFIMPDVPFIRHSQSASTSEELTMQKQWHAVPADGVPDVVEVCPVKDDTQGGGTVSHGYPVSPQIIRNPGLQFQNLGLCW